MVIPTTRQRRGPILRHHINIGRTQNRRDELTTGIRLNQPAGSSLPLVRIRDKDMDVTFIGHNDLEILLTKFLHILRSRLDALIRAVTG
jgi:hypothetical protein